MAAIPRRNLEVAVWKTTATTDRPQLLDACGGRLAGSRWRSPRPLPARTSRCAGLLRRPSCLWLYPHENFAGEAIAPVGLGATGGDAGAERGPEARDGVEIAAVAFALRGEKAGFFAQDQAVGNDEHSDDLDDEAQQAGAWGEADGDQVVT